MTFEEILPAVRAGGRASRTAWYGRYGVAWGACWVELVHPVLPDGRTLMPQLVIGYPDESMLRPFAGANWDLLAGDWDLCSPAAQDRLGGAVGNEEPGEFTREEMARLLQLAGVVVTWTTQGTLNPAAAGYPHLVKARQEFIRTRMEMQGAYGHRFTVADTGGCTCGGHEIEESCLYHYAARLQPLNHRIPWNCPTYYDGCNCDKTEQETGNG